MLRDPGLADSVTADTLATGLLPGGTDRDLRAARIELCRTLVVRATEAAGRPALGWWPAPGLPGAVPDPVDALGAMPPWTRAAAALRFGLGVPVDEVAEVLRVSPGDVERLLRDALAAGRAPGPVPSTDGPPDILADPQLSARLRAALAGVIAAPPPIDTAKLVREARHRRRSARLGLVSVGWIAALRHRRGRPPRRGGAHPLDAGERADARPATVGRAAVL